MENPQKTLIERLYEKIEMKSLIMTEEEFNNIPLTDGYKHYQNKKLEKKKTEEKLLSDSK